MIDPMSRNAQSFIVEKVEMPGEPGAIQVCFGWNDENKDVVMGINHCCPCGCGLWGWMPFKTYNPTKCWEPTPKKGDDYTKLTLTPSIGFIRQQNGGYHWHGYLRNGVFEEC
jgi:hypothetical protein